MNATGTTYAGSLRYAAHGGLTSMAMGDGLTRTFGYNTRLQTGSVAARSLLNLGLSWNANGTLASQSIARSGGFSATQSYTYDGVNRLKTAAEGSNWNQTYVYDAVGNRALTASSSAPGYGPSSSDGVTVPFNGNNQWSGAGNPAAYDAAGNTTALTVPATGDTRTMTYDAESRMTSWVDGSVTGSTVTLTYDGDGRRVTKTSLGATTTCVYDPAGNLAAEYGGSAAATQTLYVTQDHLGSTRLVTTSGGACVGAHDYLPFGEEIAAGWGRSGVPCYGATDTTVKFTGQERDPENGLDNFLARHMDAGIGRFLSPDPAGDFLADLTNPQSWNMYAYVLNNPLVFVDPTGLFGDCPGGTVVNNQCIQPSPPPPIDCRVLINSLFNPACGGGVPQGPTISAPPPQPPPPPRPGKGPPTPGNVCSAAAGSTRGGAMRSGSYTFPFTGLGALIGGLFGPEAILPGALIGSMFGAGPTASYVPATKSVYGGVQIGFGLGINGGSGGNISQVNVPVTQNPNSIANGKSFSVTYQPTIVTGSTVTKSPGSGPAVVGFSIGTKVPVSLSAGYNICLRNCQCP